MNTKNLRAGLVLLFVLAWLVLPAVIERHMVDTFNFAALLAIGGLGVGMLLGQCGIVNLGQAAFYGIGAYATAYGTTALDWHWLPSMLAGMLLSGGLAAVIGYPILRLNGFFLALATLAVGSIASVLFFEWDWLTGGTLGVGGIPKLSLMGYELSDPTRFHYFIWPLVALLLWLAGNLVNSRQGLAMRAMRDAAPAAEMLSIDMHRIKTTMFVICAVLGALAGSLFAHYVSFVSVQSFTVERSILFLLVPVVAGARSVLGIVIGALFVALMPEALSMLGDMHQVLFGLALVIVVTLLPGGLTGLAARLVAWKERK